jgi:hypothetical protein
MQEFRTLMDDYLSEQGHEQIHAAGNGGAEGDAEPDELEIMEGAQDAEEMEGEEGEGEAGDELGEVAPEAHVVSYGADRARARDSRRNRGNNTDRVRAADAAASTSAARSALKAMKPFVARSGDSALIGAFNAQVRRISGRSQASTSSYAGFSQGARDHGRARDSRVSDNEKAIDDFYKSAHNKKRNIGAEVN